MADANGEMFMEMRRQIEELRLQIHDVLFEREHEEKEEEPDPLLHAVAAVGIVQNLQQAFTALTAAVDRDATRDDQVGQKLEEVSRLLSEQTAAMKSLQQTNERLCTVLEVLASPRVRTGRVMLPTGPVEMTISEAHQPRKVN